MLYPAELPGQKDRIQFSTSCFVNMYIITHFSYFYTMFGAAGGIRTRMTSRSTDFKSVVYTSSTTAANPIVKDPKDFLRDNRIIPCLRSLYTVSGLAFAFFR